MRAQAIRMNATEERDPRMSARRAPRPTSWSGTESAWVLAAIAAAPWPLWSGLALLGVPGAAYVPPFSHGVLPLTLALALMGLFTHRPDGRSAVRWIATLIGTGLLGELLANALTDMGRGPGLGAASDGARALSVWLICVTVYEIAPIVAATSRVARAERRSVPVDVVAHGGFLLAAWGAYAWPPTWGTAWFVSPWLVVAAALPLAAARAGPEREARLPLPHPRPGLTLGGAVLAWATLALVTVARAGVIEDSWHEMRWGVDPLEGVLLAFPATSLALSLAAAVALLTRARAAARSPSGTVSEVGDRGLTIDRGGRDPASVAIQSGPLPGVGDTVTLLGAGLEPPGGGPFRDGAHQLRARRAWLGRPEALRQTLRHRAAGWALYAAVAAFGVLLRLL